MIFKLVDFAQEVQFERLGVFKYSDEEDTAAFDLDPKGTLQNETLRFDKLMRRQKRFRNNCKRWLVKSMKQLRVSEEHDHLVQGRLWSQAPKLTVSLICHQSAS